MPDAVESLLHRLTTVLLDEAQLLGKLHGEVQFIKDEMESMNGFLMHLDKATGEEGPDHHVRAWTNQVLNLAYECQYCVDLYMYCHGAGPHDVGVLGCLAWLPWFLWTLPLRHRTAMRIRELKVRVLEVSERRQRYDITIPVLREGDNPRQSPAPSDGARGERPPDGDLRRGALVHDETECFGAHADKIVEYLITEKERRLRLIVIVGPDDPENAIRRRLHLESSIARRVYQHCSLARSYDSKAWLTVGKDPRHRRLDEEILEQLLPNFRLHWNFEAKFLLSFILSGEKFLIVLDDIWEHSTYVDIVSALNVVTADGSAIILTTKKRQVVDSLPPLYNEMGFFLCDVTAPESSPANFFLEKAHIIVPNNEALDSHINFIISHCKADVFAMKMLLNVLYVNPDGTLDQDLKKLEESLSAKTLCLANQTMLKFCFDKLPDLCKRCLLYLTIFPQGYKIRRTSLVRRWVVDGLLSI